MSLRPGLRYPQISLMIATETPKWGCLTDPRYAYKVRHYGVVMLAIDVSSLADLPADVNAVDLSMARSTSR